MLCSFSETLFTVSISWVTWLCVWLVSSSRRLRCVSGLHCWNAAAAHISTPPWCYYDHRLPWGDPNEDAEDAHSASCCFQSGHRWVRYSGCCKLFCSICWQLVWNEVAWCDLLLAGSWAATEETREWAAFFRLFVYKQDLCRGREAHRHQ